VWEWQYTFLTFVGDGGGWSVLAVEYMHRLLREFDGYRQTDWYR
jgi:hypothetical protein